MRKRVNKLGAGIRSLSIIAWWLLAVSLLGLIFYGLSAIAARPTVETVTTPVPTQTPVTEGIREANFPRRRSRNH